MDELRIEGGHVVEVPNVIWCTGLRDGPHRGLARSPFLGAYYGVCSPNGIDRRKLKLADTIVGLDGVQV